MSELSLNDVYITSAGTFMPNDPISNDEMEDYLGRIGGQPSRYKKHVLSANGITKRYYARTKEGKQTHLNEEMAALAIQDTLQKRGISVDQIEMLATATTIPDVLMPGFGSMVHGRIGGGPIDVLSAGGICSASMSAMKAAWLALRAGDHNNAMVVGSELASVMMKAERFEQESILSEDIGGKIDSFKFFNADFLRWMLSDGAGAVYLENKPLEGRLNLKIDWIDYKSYAHTLPACMYLGTHKTQNLVVGDTFQSYASLSDADKAGLFVIRQDTNFLPQGLLQSVVVEAGKLTKSGKLKPENIDHFLPHISSYFFYDKFIGALTEMGLAIPKEKWFTNLSTKGNTGAASIFIMLEEALNGGLFKEGDRIVTMVPESGRFAVSYAHFTCVRG